jgi:hypothetical protein
MNHLLRRVFIPAVITPSACNVTRGRAWRLVCCGLASALMVIVAGCSTNGNSAASSSSALRGQTRFALEAIDMRSITVDETSEKDFLASKQPQQIASWEADKQAIEQNFKAAVMGAAPRFGLTMTELNGDSPYLIRAQVISIVNGRYVPFAVSRAHMKLKVVITDRSGKSVEEFQLADSVRFDLVGDQSSSGGRLRLLATALGEKTAAHLGKLTK